MVKRWIQRVMQAITPLSPVSLLLVVLLFPLNKAAMLPLLLINSVVCYAGYRDDINEYYKLVPCWVFPLLLEVGVLLIGTKQMFLFSIGILLILLGSVGTYETWPSLKKLLSRFWRGWFILCFPAAFLLVTVVHPPQFWSFFSGFVVVVYGFLGLRAHRQVFEEQGSYVRGMDFLGKKENEKNKNTKKIKPKSAGPLRAVRRKQPVPTKTNQI